MITYNLEDLNQILPKLRIKKVVVSHGFKTQIDADINIQQAYSFYKRMIEKHKDDEKISRSPAGQRNCNDMRILVNDFDMEIETAINVMKQVFIDLGLNLTIDEEKDWQQYCDDYCQSDRGNKVYTKEKHVENLKNMIDMEETCRQMDEEIERLNQKRDDWDEMAEINEALDLSDGLPDFIRGIPEYTPPPPDIWEGLVAKGTKVMIAGTSKSHKSWTMLGIALSIASGRPHWTYKTSQLKTLYCNFEIGETFFKNRIYHVGTKMGIDKVEILPWFTHLNLRGLNIGNVDLIKKLIGRIKRNNIEVVFLDPLYKLYNDLDENSARDMGKLMTMFEQICEETGATLFITHHYPKGKNYNAKTALDRAAGSGVFGRDPDSCISLTPQRDDCDNTLVVDCSLRNHKEVPKFCVTWDFPLMLRDDNTEPIVEGAKEEKFSITDILNVLQQSGKSMTKGELSGKIGMSAKTLDRKINDNRELIDIKKVGRTNVYQINQKGTDFLTSGTYDIEVKKEQMSNVQDEAMSNVQDGNVQH